MSDADPAKDVETQSRPAQDSEAGVVNGKQDAEDKAKQAVASGGDDAQTREDKSTADSKDDSDAETVVLPGKEDELSSPHHKAIKHEGNEDTKVVVSERKGEARSGKDLNPNSDSQEKKNGKDLTATSSNLSSAKSSPAPDTAPSPAASDSEFAKPSSNFDDDRPKGLLLRKRKNNSEDSDEKIHKRRQRRDVSIESAANTTASDRDRREKRASNMRSESPPPRTRTRTHSIKSSQVPGQKRKKPPPLQVSSRTRASADIDDGSEDSDRRPSLQKVRKLHSMDSAAMSPAKLPHKKLRDKSGRTILARACDQEDGESVKARLLERPDDLDIPDYAGNTPLQIASLAGNDDAVKVLLDAGCDINCKNVDKDTPLIDAVENGHLDVIRLLLEAGMDPAQSNARGEDLLDLLSLDSDNHDEIKEVLIKAREQRRRSSDDNQGSRASVSARSPTRESAHPSPPPSLPSSRRKPSRRERTRNDLLYITPTPEILREKAKIGDITAVDYILQMRPIADMPAVLAAARGAHETTLQLLIAIGKPEHDPDPLAGEKTSQSTPMLAAIGRGSIRVIELLLEQPGFNPTRRLYKGLTYHEIAKERRGQNWEEEYRVLKRAYDKHKSRNANGSSPSSKRDSHSQRELKKSKSESITVTGNASKRSSPELTKDGFTRRKGGLEIKRTLQRRETDRESDKKHLRVPSKTMSREQSTAISDREVSPMAVPKDKEKKHKRSMSDAELQEKEMPKPTRKRLVSAKAFKDGQDKRRRESLASVASSSSQEHARQKDGHNSQTKKIKREESREPAKISNLEHTKKRPRASPTPSDGNSPKVRKSPDLKKAKRLRVDSEGKPTQRNDASSASVKRDSPQPPVRTSSQSAAPVAFMGGAAPQSKETKSKLIDPGKESPKSELRKPTPLASPKSTSSSKDEKRERDSEDKQQKDTNKQLHEQTQAAAKDEERRRQEQEARENAAIEKAQEEQEERERVKKEKELLEQQEREKKAREEAAAKEAERLAQEKEAQRLAQEEAERKAKMEREEEEARQEQKRREEEAARQLAEKERQRKEEEERQRRRAEQEERERLARIRRREEEERRKREALPNALKILAEMSPEQAKQESEAQHWLPLYTVKTSQLAPADPQADDDLWVCNVQVAPLLGLTDLDLSQYTGWAKRMATKSERLSIWRVLRKRLTRYEPPEFSIGDAKVEFHMDKECREKYEALNRVFWIRLSDLQDIAPRYPHLTGIELSTYAIALTTADSTSLSPLINGHHSPPTNGNFGAIPLTNGYH